jgi:cytochrome c556
MRRFLGAGLSLVALVGVSFAADDPIKARQKLMKANGETSKAVASMLKGATPFKLVVAQTALHAYIEASQRGPALFPPGSDKGKTEALPAIWKNKPDFEARFAKLGEDARSALASIKDEATFKANFPPLFKDCGGCHELYRAKQK